MLLVFPHIFFLYFSFNYDFLFKLLDIADVNAIIELVVKGIHALVDKEPIEIWAEDE